MAAESPSVESEGAAEPGFEAAGLESITVAVDTVDARQDLIRTAYVDIEVDDLEAAIDGGSAFVAGLGGFASSADITNTPTNPLGTASYKVPPNEFDGALKALGELGAVSSQSSSTDDVAGEVADLDSRLATLEVSIERLRGFLSETTDPFAIGELEAELTRREGEAASIQAQRKALGDQVEHATISVTYTSPNSDEPVVAETTGFAKGLSTGVDAATGALRVAGATVGFLLPFLPVFLLAAAVIWLLRRKGTNSQPTRRLLIQRLSKCPVSDRLRRWPARDRCFG